MSAALPSGHHRTPGYVKGRAGIVVRLNGRFPDPELRAYGGDGRPPQDLYTVSFAHQDLWPHYRGPADDRIHVDLFERWLEVPR